MKTRIVRCTKILAALAVAVTPVVAAATPTDGTPSTLHALRDELATKTEPQALAALPHFRPLCDAQGYPLVGNLSRKGPAPYGPAAFCAAVRKRAGS